MTNVKENWKPIKEFEGKYDVSDLGRVRSRRMKLKTRYGSFYFKEGRVLKTALDKKGYERTAFSFKGKLLTRKIHRLVAETFIDNPENKRQVNHKNGIKNDNRLVNLEWNTESENAQHACDNNLWDTRRLARWIQNNRHIVRGENNGLSKLTKENVLEIRAKFKPRIYTREMLAKEYGVKACTIKDVILRKRWKHI